VSDWLHHLGRQPSFLTKDAEHLSGGEAQLMALLRALQLEPQVLLLDEPTASLDEGTTLKVESLLKEWQAEGERAIVTISHHPDQMARFCDRLLDLA
jgi:putative ABC transport system ATP-binding protein